MIIGTLNSGVPILFRSPLMIRSLDNGFDTSAVRLEPALHGGYF